MVVDTLENMTDDLGGNLLLLRCLELQIMFVGVGLCVWVCLPGCAQTLVCAGVRTRVLWFQRFPVSTVTLLHAIGSSSLQYFGNLVTCHWWDDLWLNEGFARYYQIKGVADVEPTWQLVG